MKKKLIGKIGALLMAVTLTFTGTTVAYAADSAEGQAPDQIKAEIERTQNDNLVKDSDDDLLEKGDGYRVYKGTPLDNGGYTAWIYVYADELKGDLNSTVSGLIDKKYTVDESYIWINYENIDAVTVSKANLQKMKNKNMIFDTTNYSSNDDFTHISYRCDKVTNADSDYVPKVSQNSDTAAIAKIKSAGISKYLTLTTGGKSGTSLPGNGYISLWAQKNVGDFDYNVTDENNSSRKFAGNLYTYYYNSTAGRFVKYANGANSDVSDDDSQAYAESYGYTYVQDFDYTWINFYDCDFNGTYVVTQGELPASLLMDSYTGLSREGNDWVYYKNGKLDRSYTGLCKYNGSWWYVKNGKVDFGATTLCKYNGSWWYVRGGKVDFSSTTLCKYNGSWWYVSGGKVHFGATGLCKYNGSWWYVKSGKVDFSATTLCKYNGYWFYVKGGRVSFTTTLCKYNGTWFYVNNGVVNFNKTTLVKYNGNWFAVTGGKVAWGYTGKMNYNGGTFNVVNGIVRF